MHFRPDLMCMSNQKKIIKYSDQKYLQVLRGRKKKKKKSRCNLPAGDLSFSKANW